MLLHKRPTLITIMVLTCSCGVFLMMEDMYQKEK